MNLFISKNFNISTPSLLLNEKVLLDSINNIKTITDKTDCKLLYSLKPQTFFAIPSIIRNYVDGFAVSSVFELRLSKKLLNSGQTLHITAPGLKKDSIEEIAENCDYINFNSMSQWLRFRDDVKNKTRCGLRINPEISFIDDERYDPCRKYSKLGVPLHELTAAFRQDPKIIDGIDGVLFHTNCDSTDFSELLTTVKHIYENIDFILEKLKWINLGGGYIFNNLQDSEDFYFACDFLKKKCDLEVFIEPGASFVREAVYLVSSVVDMFHRGGKDIAILDTTVNHMPEVFEYQFEPDIEGHIDGADNSYILAGCSCLSGDIFGEYSFEEPLETGSRIVFKNMGAYTLVKAHTFNGINLPDIYALNSDGEIKLIKQYTYEEFAQKCGAEI